MGSVYFIKKPGQNRRPPGKVDAHLTQALQQVKWAEFRIGDLFESFNGNFDIKKEHINGVGNYVITAGLSNNGILGKTDVDAKIFDKNTITIDMFGNAFYRQFQYKMVTHARVFSLKPLFEMTQKQGLFMANSFHFLKYGFGYENMCSWAKIENTKISLPTQNGEIDFDFMERFISQLEAFRLSQLEAFRLSQLEAYLLVTGLKDYTLTTAEKQALADFESGKVQWGEFRIGDLFERISTKKLNYKAVDLPKEPTNEYSLPCLTSSFQNQGLNYYVPKSGATILKNVISLPSNSDVYRGYYQSREFTVLSDAYAIKWSNEKVSFLPKHYLFSVVCINKVTDLKIYSYKNKLGGWNVVQNKCINYPVKNSEIDFDFMATFISAIQKLVIKDVVHYADRKIAATQQVIGKPSCLV